MKYKNQKTDGYKSALEAYAALRFQEEGIKFGYEPYRITLIPSFELTRLRSVERVKKKLTSSSKIRPMTYSPDFVGESWIMETKGRRTQDFNLKWKILKYLLKDEDITLYMPRSKKDVDECIEQLKHGPNTRIFQFPESLKLFVGNDQPQPEASKAQKRKPRDRRHGQKVLSNRVRRRLPDDISG